MLTPTLPKWLARRIVNPNHLLPMLFADSGMPVPNRAVSTRAPMGEIGASGQVFSANLLINQDYNQDLITPLRYDTYDKMRKGDGQIRAGLQAIKLPILQADWYMEPASEDKQDVQIANWIDDRIHSMTITFASFMRQALLSLDYGNMVFEPVWEIRDGLVNLRKLAPRLPKSITEWRIDDNGGLVGITQQVYAGPGQSSRVKIDVPKLLVFVNEQEGSDFTGNSMLRACYKHWFYKDRLYIIDAIAKERRGVGVDVGTFHGSEVSDDDRTRLEYSLMGLHAHEKQFMIEQAERYTYRVEGLNGSIVSSLESIEHHDLRMLRALLAEFIAMGAGSTGSLAMHEDKTSFFMMSELAITQMIKDTINNYLIKQWVDYNWDVKGNYPTLCHSRLDVRNIDELSKAVSAFVTAGTLTPDVEIEAEIRSVLDFPEMSDDLQEFWPDTEAPSDMPAMPTIPPNLPTDVPPTQDPNAPPLPIASSSRDYIHSQLARQTRKRTTQRLSPNAYRPAVQTKTPTRWTYARKVDFAAINNAMDRGEEQILYHAKTGQSKQINTLVRVVTTALRRNDVGKLSELTVPNKAEISDSIAEVLLSLYETGKDTVRVELDMALDFEDDYDVKEFLTIRAKAVTSILADKLKSNIVWTALQQFRNGVVDEDELRTNLKRLSDREINKIAANSVSEAINLGRETMAKRKSAKGKAIFSCVLDKNSCPDCEHADGTEVVVGSPEYDALRPPYQNCDGGNRCRCVFIYIG